MSTEWIKVRSSNPNFPNDTLEFVTGVSGNYFFIRPEGEQAIKFWFNKDSWEKLKEVVDMAIVD